MTCGNIIDAYFIKDRLTNEGIECFLTNENFKSLLTLRTGNSVIME